MPECDAPFGQLRLFCSHCRNAPSVHLPRATQSLLPNYVPHERQRCGNTCCDDTQQHPTTRDNIRQHPTTPDNTREHLAVGPIFADVANVANVANIGYFADAGYCR
jgi:hypothetical protein